jgi:hypothetical protein
MTLEELERICEAIGRAIVSSTSLEQELGAVGLAHRKNAALRLLRDEQFYVLLDLKRAERDLERAYEKLTPQTDYLKEELEEALGHLQVLLLKMSQEESLRRDREALLSGFFQHSPEQGDPMESA